MLHTGNAHVEDNQIVCTSPEFPVAAFPADGLENTWQEFQKAVLTRWTLDLDSGKTWCFKLRTAADVGDRTNRQG